MKKTAFPRIFAGLLVILGTCHLARAAATNAPSRFDYESFRIISERNIFDANRSPRGGRNRRDRSTDRSIKTESFALLGTMSYEKGIFAFFDGTSSEYRKARTAMDTIAGFKITEISPNLVKLEGNGTNIEMTVSMQMKKEEEGEWHLAGSGKSIEASPSLTSDTSTNAPEGAAGLSALEEKLMKQREQELNK